MRYVSKVNEVRHLIKIEVFYNSNTWSLNYETKAYTFRGDEVAFRKFLMAIHAKDSNTTPRSYRGERYADIVKEIMDGSDRIIYVWSNDFYNIINRKKESESMNMNESLNERYLIQLNKASNGYVLKYEDSYFDSHDYFVIDWNFQQNKNSTVYNSHKSCQFLFDALASAGKKLQQLVFGKIYALIPDKYPFGTNFKIIEYPYKPSRYFESTSDYNKEFINEASDYDINLLARLKADCDYILGACNSNPGSLRHLWAGEGKVEDQIAEMRKLYKSTKAQFISEKDIDEYEKKLLAIKAKSQWKNEEAEMKNTILIEKSIKIPGTNIILEKGDRIYVSPKNEKSFKTDKNTIELNDSDNRLISDLFYELSQNKNWEIVKPGFAISKEGDAVKVEGNQFKLIDKQTERVVFCPLKGSKFELKDDGKLFITFYGTTTELM